MSKVVYRGCQYDTEDAKKEYETWYLKTHAPAHPQNKYRGVAYRPCKNMEVQQ